MGHIRHSGMYMITVPAGCCGKTLKEAKKMHDKIISAISRRLCGKDYTIDLLSGVADIDLDKGEYLNIPTGSKGRPRREKAINANCEYIFDPDPHIHMILACNPGSSTVNTILEIINQRIPPDKRANLQDISTEWSSKKIYVIKQSRYFRVIEKGDPHLLPHREWQFCKYGRGKSQPLTNRHCIKKVG